MTLHKIAGCVAGRTGGAMSMSKQDFIELADAIRAFNQLHTDGSNTANHFDTQQIGVLADFCQTAIALAAKENWLHRALAAFDIAFNVIFLRGQQDETISTHSYRAAVEGKLWGKSQNPNFKRQRWLGYIAGTNGPNGGAV